MADQHYDLIVIGSGPAGVFRSLLEVRADSCRQVPRRPHRLNGTSIRPSSSAKRSFMVCLGILSAAFFSEAHVYSGRTTQIVTKPWSEKNHSGCLWLPRTHHLDVLSQAEQRQQLDSPVVEIYFPPGHTVACGHGICMVVIVPAFASGQ